jgi:hypothetical protein
MSRSVVRLSYAEVIGTAASCSSVHGHTRSVTLATQREAHMVQRVSLCTTGSSASVALCDPPHWSIDMMMRCTDLFSRRTGCTTTPFLLTTHFDRRCSRRRVHHRQQSALTATNHHHSPPPRHALDRSNGLPAVGLGLETTRNRCNYQLSAHTCAAPGVSGSLLRCNPQAKGII